MKTLLLYLFLTTSVYAYEEKELVAAVLIAEAGGEGRKGMEAVNEVIVERSTARKQSLAHIVTAKWQFSCLNKRTPDELIAIAKKRANWNEALDVVKKPLTKHTAHANHYFATWMKSPPHWAEGRKPVATIGQHAFYRL